LVGSIVYDVNIYLLKIMNIRPSKALLALALITSCNVVLTPNPAAAQTTLPRITVVGSRSWSTAEVENFLNGLKPPSLIDTLESMLPDFLGGGEEITPEFTMSLTYFDGCSSQQTRTDVVAREIFHLVNAANAVRSSSFQNGTVFGVSYNDQSRENFVVTSVTSSAVVVTPIEGSYSGCR
jgi:hypothetical protein